LLNVIASANWPSASPCVASATVVVHFTTCGRIFSRLRHARSVSSGYSCSFGTPSARRAISMELTLPSWPAGSARGPGNFATSQYSAQERGWRSRLKTFVL
jgi:hypothetical protein